MNYEGQICRAPMERPGGCAFVYEQGQYPDGGGGGHPPASRSVQCPDVRKSETGEELWKMTDRKDMLQEA